MMTPEHRKKIAKANEYKETPKKKKCPRCRCTKLAKFFGTRSARRKYGKPVLLLRSCCRKCEDAKGRAWQVLHPESVKRNNHRSGIRRMGITPAEYDTMVRNQNGLCAICNTEPPRRFDIDHDHITGRIRALLCSNCNTAIGLLRENVAVLRAAIAYIEFHTKGIR